AFPAAFFVAYATEQVPEGILNTEQTPYDNPQGNVQICHAENDNQEVNISAIVNGTGHGGHDEDIIPPFWYQLNEEDPIELYEGNNWNEDTMEIWKNDCEEEEVVIVQPDCDEDEIIVDNQCVPEVPDCEEGYTLDDNECVPEPQECVNLLENGSFETPVVENANLWDKFGVVAGWTIEQVLNNAPTTLELHRNWSSNEAAAGAQYAELDGDHSTKVSQTVGLIDGATYELKWAFAPRHDITADQNQLAVLIDGSEVGTNGPATASANLTPADWTQGSHTFVADDTSATITFADAGPSNSYGTFLDDARLCLVREPDDETENSCIEPNSLGDDSEFDLGGSGEPSLDTILDNNGFAAIDELADQINTQVWDFDSVDSDSTTFTVTLLAKYAGNNQAFGYYEAGDDSTFVPLFKVGAHSAAVPTLAVGDSIEVTVPNDGSFGFALDSEGSPSNVWFSEFALNPGTEDNVAVYNPEDNTYVLAFEDLQNGDNDFNDLVVKINEVECKQAAKTGDVTLCKYGSNEQLLSNWQLSLLGEPVESLNVPANNILGINTVTILDDATPYVAIAEGTWNNNRTPLNIVDAEYSTEDTWLTHMDGFTGYSTSILELQINSAFDPDSDWGDYNSLHRYAQGFTVSSDAPANLRMFDGNGTTPEASWYGDNTGELPVTIYQGYTGVTGENGCVTFSDVPLGSYMVDEIMQDGWQNVSGLGEVVIEGDMTLNVVNRDISEVPVATIIAEKVVCEDEADLPNWNDEGSAAKITAATASDWVEQSDGACWLEPDWQFEWGTENAFDPGDTLVGPAGSAAWTTFGPTDENGVATAYLTEDDIDGDSYVWMREVLQEGYIPFTHEATPDNSNNETAEMYCHIDGLNYDNLDRVDGIEVGETYHCVAFNTQIEKPVEQCTLEMYSDEGTVVVERNGYALATYASHPAWTADIPGATWVWDTLQANEIDDEESEIFTFKETFTVNNPTLGDLDIAADNDYELIVNGVTVVSFADGGDDSHYGSLTKDDIDLLPFLVDGDNEIIVKVKNFGLTNSSYIQNPAGLLYKLVVKGDNDEACDVTTDIVPPEVIDVCPNLPDNQTVIP
ncbi:MAG: DUF4114 domain-containing protein, partial [Patescibacteria group bacterium]